MRLWSAVVTQPATRPRRQSARYASALTATSLTLVDYRIEILLEHPELLVIPPAGHRGHLSAAVAEQLLEPLGLDQERVVRDLRAVVAFALWPVALRADADPFVPAETQGPLMSDPRLVLVLRFDHDARTHLRVEHAAELAATATVGPDPVGLEPRVRALTGDGVELAAELGNPPAVVDIARVDVHPDDLVQGRVQLVDRDGAVWVRELPADVGRAGPDPDRPALRPRAGHVLDSRQLVEDERRDRGEDQHRDHRPDQLEPCVSVDLRTLGGPRTPPPPVAEDEPEQRAFDEHEDRAGEDRDPLVRVIDAARVRGVRRLGRKAAVARVGDAGERQRGAESKHEDEGLAPHRRVASYEMMARQFRCVGRRVQTDARAEPVRPEVGTASGGLGDGCE